MKKKLIEWAKRYLPAEIPATIGAIIGASLIFHTTGDPILSAYAGSIAENIGYYGFITIREHIHDTRKSKSDGRKHGIKGVLKTLRNLLLEFGVAEFLDSLIVRPFCMYVFPRIIGEFTTGVIVGKIVADIVFYIPSIIAYELRKKHLE